MRSILALSLLCLAAGPALSASGDGSFAVDGPGNQTCRTFVEALDSGDERAAVAFAAWTEGFITGVNVFRDQTFDITPWQTTPLLMAKMRGFCAEKPEMAYVNALGRLIATLVPQRMTEGSDLVQMRSGGSAVALPAAVLARVRAALEDATGESIATPDASFDGRFVGAIMAYQQDQGLPQTGLPDQPTLNALFP